MPRKVNLQYLKQLAKNAYVFSVIKTLCDEACSIGWKIAVKDEFQEDGKDYEEKTKEITRFFDNPNGNNESFEHLLRQWITGICEADAGLGVKVFTQTGELKHLFGRDGATFLKNPDIYGYLGERADFVAPMSPNVASTMIGLEGANPVKMELMKQYDALYKQSAAYFQYGWTAGSMPVPFGKREVIYFMQNPRPDSIYGRSPVEVLAEIIMSLVYGSEANLDLYTNNNMPEGVIQLLGAEQAQIKQFRENFEKQFKFVDSLGKKRKRFYQYPLSSTEVKFTPFQLTSKELDIITQQEWFTKVLWMCFPDDVEILTDEGWKLFKDLSKKELIAEVDNDNLEISFNKPSEYIEYEYNGKLVEFRTKTMDLVVTPEHRILFKDKYKFYDNPETDWNTDEAKNIHSEVIIPQAGIWKGNEIKDKFGFSGDNFSKFMGIWLADGCLDKNRIVLYSSERYKEIFEEIRSLLKEMKIDYNEREYATRWTENKGYIIRFTNEELALYLKQFGKAKDKYIPFEIKNSIPRQIRFFLDWFEKGDGSITRKDCGRRFGSKSKRLLDDVQEMLLKVKVASTLYHNKHYDSWELGERKNKTEKFETKFYSRIRGEDIKNIDYKGKVYCVTMPKGYIVVRKNGKTAITGNCFGVTANEMGFTETVNKSVGEEQAKLAKRKALKPMLQVIQYHLNTQLLPEFFVNKGEMPDFGDIPLEFKFKHYDIEEDKLKHDILDQEIRMGIKTPEMVAIELGINLEELKKYKEEERERNKEDNKLKFENQAFFATNGQSQNGFSSPNKKQEGNEARPPLKKKEPEEKAKSEAEKIIQETKDPFKELDKHIDTMGEQLVQAVDRIPENEFGE